MPNSSVSSGKESLDLLCQELYEGGGHHGVGNIGVFKVVVRLWYHLHQDTQQLSVLLERIATPKLNLGFFCLELITITRQITINNNSTIWIKAQFQLWTIDKQNAFYMKQTLRMDWCWYELYNLPSRTMSSIKGW